MHIPRLVQSCYLWNQESYRSQPVKLFGFTIYWKPPKKQRDTDSLHYLLDLGFKVGLDFYDSRFYEVDLPKGWYVKEQGYWTDYFDSSGAKRISQFDKWASYDSAHFIDILK